MSPDDKKFIRRRANADMINIRSQKKLAKINTFVKKRNDKTINAVEQRPLVRYIKKTLRALN
jgi:hypothetical protein